jgi:membrane protease YdiL (CAAX protease family)
VRQGGKVISLDKRHRIVFWIVISLLLILRMPLHSWTEYLFPATSIWITPAYEVGTYLLTAFLIWWERKQFSLHNLDFLAVLIIIIFKPLSIILLPLFGAFANPIAFPHLLSFSFFLISLVLLGLIAFKKINIGKLNRKGLLWIVFGSVTGIVFFVAYAVIMIRFFDYPVPPDPGSTAWVAPIYQLGFAAVAEEPVFRGFLWGGLLRSGMKKYWILLIQAILFTLSHIHLLSTPQPFLSLSVIFIDAIIMGLFVWRSRSLSSSMALHGFANGSIIVQYWVISILFR